MTGAAPARRLLAQLVDERAIETEPIAEIRADLAALGIDPARAIALSRRLAADAGSPAAALLRRISESEEEDDEIRRIERADIAAVRRELPEGLTAATAARAHRAAGGDSNVVGLRPRRARRLLYGMSGLAAAMAASLVLYVGLSTDRPFQVVPRQVSESAAPASVATAPADEARRESAATERHRFSGDDIQALNQPAASGLQQPAMPQAAAPIPAPPGEDEAEPLPYSPRADQPPAAAAESVDRLSRKAAPPAEEPAESERDRSLDLAARSSGLGGAAQMQMGPPAGPFGLAHPVTALLIVDPGLAPAGLRQEDYPPGDLPARLDDARRLAGDHRIVALVAMAVEGRPVDAVVLASDTRAQTMMSEAAPATAPLGPVLPGFELVEIGRR